MNLLKEKEKLEKFRKDLKDFQKSEVYEKLTNKDVVDTNEDLRYAFEYLDEVIKAIPNITMCLYHAEVFLKNK